MKAARSLLSSSLVLALALSLRAATEETEPAPAAHTPAESPAPAHNEPAPAPPAAPHDAPAHPPAPPPLAHTAPAVAPAHPAADTPPAEVHTPPPVPSPAAAEATPLPAHDAHPAVAVAHPAPAVEAHPAPAPDAAPPEIHALPPLPARAELTSAPQPEAAFIPPAPAPAHPPAQAAAAPQPDAPFIPPALAPAPPAPHPTTAPLVNHEPTPPPAPHPEAAPSHPPAAELTSAHPAAPAASIVIETGGEPDHAAPTHEAPPAHNTAATTHNEGPAHAAADDTTPPEAEAEFASLMRIGSAKLSAKDAAAAIIAFRQASRLAKGDAVAPALLNLARAHRLGGDSVKAVAVYERLTLDHPSWSGVPEALLEVGRTLRELGAPRLALARFYSVIHSTLKMPEAEADHYRQLVRTAQFEIAETHLALGDGAEAARFFRRLDLLDLTPADRARARFRTAQAQLLDGDRKNALITLSRFIAQDGDAADAAEARFLLARIHAEEGRREEALVITLELLRKSQAAENSANWRGWQRRAGNFLANRFYEEGEFYSALLLYRALDLLDNTPAWRAPILYQIGLSLEQLQQPEEARATYAEIATLLAAPADAAQKDLARMAAWRSDQLAWAGRVRTEIQQLSKKEESHPLATAANP